MSRLRVIGLRLTGAYQIHPKCLVGARVRIDRAYRLSMGSRCVLCDDVHLYILSPAARLSIGTHGFLAKGVQVEVVASVDIGSHCLIGPGVYMTDHNHDISQGCAVCEAPCIPAPICIEDDVWIGANAVILPGVTLGAHSVVAAGAVVSRSVPAGTIVAGVPAMAIGVRPAFSRCDE